jgi:cell wall-associated NlpC family hydrolase
MNDPRLTLVLNGVAAASLAGVICADAYRETTAMRCIAPSTAIRFEPSATALQDDQLLFGEGFEVLDAVGDFLFGQARRDGYVGYVDKAALSTALVQPTHWVSALRTYGFSRPDLKSAPVTTLSLNSLVAADEREGRFVRVADAGWVFEDHLAPIGTYLDDIVEVATRYLGAAYLWGGRDSVGLDCSGLLQQALYACGRWAPRDTDQQEEALGVRIERERLQRGDLVFWKGHVGLMLDERRLLHANAHHMATAIEPLDQAIERIAPIAGRPTAFKRL